jgi:transposase-like protein
VQPRTFGDLITLNRFHSDHRCSFCKRHRERAARYSDRRYVCTDCAEQRVNVVLPGVARHERLQERLAELGTLERRRANQA